MRLDVRAESEEFTHAAPGYIWEECTVWCNGELIPHVIALDTCEGWVLAFAPGTGWDFGQTVLHQGKVEHCMRLAYDQGEPVKHMTALRRFGAGI